MQDDGPVIDHHTLEKHVNSGGSHIKRPQQQDAAIHLEKAFPPQQLRKAHKREAARGQQGGHAQPVRHRVPSQVDSQALKDELVEGRQSNRGPFRSDGFYVNGFHDTREQQK